MITQSRSEGIHRRDRRDRRDRNFFSFSANSASSAARCLSHCVVIGVLLTALAGCGKKAGGPQAGAPGGPGAPGGSDPSSPPLAGPAYSTAREKPPIVVTTTAKEFKLSAADFYAEYNRPNSEAWKKYNGKTIELTGTVGRVGTLANGLPMICLEAGGDPQGVMCIFEKMDEDFGEKVSRGQQVRIRGKWPLNSRHGGLSECQIVGR